MLSTELKTDSTGEDKLWFLTGFASLTPDVKEKFLLELVALCEHYYRAGVLEGATKDYLDEDYLDRLLLGRWVGQKITSTALEPPPCSYPNYPVDGKKLLEDNLDPDGFLVQIVTALKT